jgi:hypothetical protein
MDQRARLERRRSARRRLRRQRRLAALGVAIVVALAIALPLALGGESSRKRSATVAGRKVPPKPPDLPRGGREIFPRYRVVAYYGAPQDRALGALGIGTPAQAVARLNRQARPYARGREVLPALELITVVASGAAHGDGKYRFRQGNATVARYLAAARRARALLLLDIQPGRADFLTEVKRLEPFLREPDVGLALDPEWHVGPSQVPGKVIGSMDASDVNAISAYLARIVRDRKLPDKLLVVHQFTDGMIRNKPLLRKHGGVALTLNVDGFGTAADKLSKYDLFARGSPRFHHGFKLFYHEDKGLMAPRDVLRIRPRPEFVVYE